MTSKPLRDDIEFLHELLPPLLKRFGKEKLVQAINEIAGSRHEDKPERAGFGAETLRERNRTSHRPTAVAIAERTDAPPRKKTLLVNLASQFDRKTFLPTLPDIRHFLEMRGQNLGTVKQRGDAFRKVASAVISMSDEALEQLINNSRYSGPSQLGPLSEAIKAVGAAGRSERISSDLFDGESREGNNAASDRTSHDITEAGGATSHNDGATLENFARDSEPTTRYTLEPEGSVTTSQVTSSLEAQIGSNTSQPPASDEKDPSQGGRREPKHSQRSHNRHLRGKHGGPSDRRR